MSAHDREDDEPTTLRGHRREDTAVSPGGQKPPSPADRAEVRPADDAVNPGKVTAQDLRRVLARIDSGSESSTDTDTPKFHDLSEMLRQAQRERLASAGLDVKRTLPTGDCPPELEEVFAGVSAAAQARVKSRKPSGAKATLPSVPPPAPSLVKETKPRANPSSPKARPSRAAEGLGGWIAMMLAGAALVVVGILLERQVLSAPGPSEARLVWSLTDPEARLEIDGEAQAPQGATGFPCSDEPITATLTRAGSPAEQYRIPCGGQIILRVGPASSAEP